MSIKKDVFFISFLSLLILNMVIIFFGVYSHFFNTNDYTLIAGIIAFFGAIIGGVITLVGVKLTIRNSQEVQKKSERKYEYIKLCQLLRQLNKLCEEESFKFFEDRIDVRDIVNNITKKIGTKTDIYQLSLESPSIHYLLLELDEYLVFLSERYYYEGEIEGTTNSKVFVEIMKKINEIIETIKERVNFLEKYI